MLLPVSTAASTRRQTVCAAALALACSTSRPLAALAAAELSEEQSLIVEAWATVQRGYVDQQFGGKDWKAIKSDYLKRPYKNMGEARAAVGDMLMQLGDRYTRYLTPGAYETLLSKYERPADNGGIGVTLRNAAGKDKQLGPVEIVSVVQGAPAEAAGLQVGDIFEAIDGRPLAAGATADDAAGLILGPLVEPVRVGVRRADGSTASVELRRAVLKAGEAEARSASDAQGRRVGVLTLRTFSAPTGGGGGGGAGGDGGSGGGTLESMRRALADPSLASADVLLIDLRGNLGGHFPSGVEAAKLFLPPDVTVVATVDRTGKPSPILTFEAGPYARKARPVYVLVDRGTASASEVFAAALQQNRAAKVVGEVTYGKGLVQSIQRLSTDGGAVVLTVAKYRTPRNDDINGRGIVPDLPVACAPASDAVACLDAALGGPS